MTFGGAGGSGGTSGGGATGGNGGNGGGIILIVAAIYSPTGNVTSNGADGTNAIGNPGHSAGGGGGGAGGSILIKAQVATLGTTHTATPGATGSAAEGAPSGHASGTGRVHLDYLNSYTGTTDPAASTQQLTLPSIPIPTINTIYPTMACPPNGDPIAFRGQGGIADLSGAMITAYVWRSDIDGLLSTQASFTRSASTLSFGIHHIFFKVKDSNNNWSDEVSHQVVVAYCLYFPFVRK